MSHITEPTFEDDVIKAINSLDGVACVNLREPTPGDFERVVKAYAEARSELKALQVQYNERAVAMRSTGDVVRALYKPKLEKALEELKKTQDELAMYKAKFADALDMYTEMRRELNACYDDLK